MSDPYTPTIEEVREAVAEWMWGRRMFRADLTVSDGGELDRAIAKVKADTLREAADIMLDYEDGLPFDDDYDRAIAAAWTNELADQMEPGAS